MGRINIQIKTFFFIGDSVTRDSVESQQKGIVYVGDSSAKMSRGLANLEPEHHSIVKNVIEALPSRIVAIHTCWPTSFAADVPNTVDNSMKFVTQFEFAARIRLEIGTEMETRSKLRGYGIPIHLLPLTKTGAIKVKYLNEWIKIRKLLEEASVERFAEDDNALSRVVVVPGLNDVIFRQGTPSMKNPGNVTFRDAMINHLEQHYSQPNDGEREQHHQPEQIDTVCKWLIETIEKTKGGRFLEWVKNLNVWVKIVDRQKLKFKVAIAYRDVSKRFLNKRQRITVDQDGNPTEQDGSDSFGEGGGKDGNAFRGTTNRDTSRSDSNYNETSNWF